MGWWRRGDDAVIYEFKKQNDASRFRHMVSFHSGLSDDQINWIRAYGDDLAKTDVKLYGEYDDTLVKARGSHFSLNDDTQWLYDLMSERAMEINEQSYRFEITGFGENFYYHTYDGNLNEHFGWHVDSGPQTPLPRKLSLVLQLSDSEEYSGGEFEVAYPHGAAPAAKMKGLITAFPSFKTHRVKPVISGIRRVLVMFAGGPHFR